jgi:FkbM family methyltransferase
MNIELFLLRIKKLATSMVHPVCWRPLTLGVAPSVEHLGILRGIKPGGILDVGANRGQFSLACRIAYPQLKVLAFEPIPEEASILCKVHGNADNIELVEAALGEERGQHTLHLSRSSDSSSLLPIGDRQVEVASQTDEVGTIVVDVAMLDDFVDRWGEKQDLLLKIDVQGFELSVLRGATKMLERCAYVYVECSEVELYVGQALRTEVEAFLMEHGFRSSTRHNEQWLAGELIQADYLFVRK